MNLAEIMTLGQLVSVLLAIAFLLAFVVHYLSRDRKNHSQ